MLVHVTAHRKPPEHPRFLDQAGAVPHVAGGAISPDDEVGSQLFAVAIAHGEAFDVTSRPERAIGPPDVGNSACVERGGAQGVVEHGPGHGPGTARVGDPVEAREDDPSSSGTYDHHVADVEPGRYR